MQVMVSFPFIPFIECELLPKAYFNNYKYKLNKTHLSPELDTWSKALPENQLMPLTRASMTNHTKLCLAYEKNKSHINRYTSF
jgi:hypothetical protein